MTLPLCYASATALHDAIKVRVAAVAEHGRYDINQLRRHFAYEPVSHPTVPRPKLDVGTQGRDRTPRPGSAACAPHTRHQLSLPSTTGSTPSSTTLTDKLVAMTSTFAGDRPSTRYRELVDIVLIAQSQTIDATELQVAVGVRMPPSRSLAAAAAHPCGQDKEERILSNRSNRAGPQRPSR